MSSWKMVSKILYIINIIKGIPNIIKEIPNVLKIIQKIWHIIKGTWFNIFNKKQVLADKRLKICETCEHRTHTFLGDACELCGCLLESKSRVKDEICDMNKW